MGACATLRGIGRLSIRHGWENNTRRRGHHCAAQTAVALNLGRAGTMSTEADPIVGNWYEHLDKGQAFEVVALDEEGATIEIQYFDGDIEEVSLENWYDLDVEGREPPEDWTGVMDDIERDDLGYTNTEMHREDWVEPLRSVKRHSGDGDSLAQEDEEDDWGEGQPEEEPWEEQD